MITPQSTLRISMPDGEKNHRELQRQAIREWIREDGFYFDRIERAKLNDVLIDGDADFEKLLDRLDALR